MIGKENIEEKIFDYFEGDLTSGEAKELENFIQENPDYQTDFDAWKQSTVANEPMEYKFADELLVQEKTSPKGWFKWASGGAFLFLVSLASVGLIDKYDGSEDRIASLQSDFEKVEVESNSTVSKNIIAKVNESVKQQVIADTYNNAESNNVLSNTIASNVKTSSVKSDVKTVKALSSEVQNWKSNITDLPKNAQGVTEKYLGSQESIKEVLKNQEKEFSKEVIDVAVLKEGAYVYVLPIALTKDKTPYDGGGRDPLFYTNNKDPYLNYALAHTIEENGSFVGNRGEGITAEFLYRTEWPSVNSDNYASQILSLDGMVDALKGGLGLMINSDRIGHGKLNANAVSLIYSPKMLVKGVSIEPSFKYTFNQKSISWNQVEENDVKDPRNGVLYASIPFTPEDVLKSTLNHHDLGLGLLVNANKFFIGGQVDHINSPSYTADFFDQDIVVPMKISAMAGTDIYKKKEGKLCFSPSVNYIKFGNYNALWANTQLAFKGFFFSGGVATNEELMASLGYGNSKVRLVYGLGFSKPSEFSGLEVSDKYYESHQLSLRVNLQPKKR